MTIGTLEDFQNLQQLYWDLVAKPRRQRRNQKGTTMNYEVYADKKTIKAEVKTRILLLTADSTAKQKVFIAAAPEGIAVLTLPEPKFSKQYVGLMWGKEPFDPKLTASEFLLSKLKFSTAALDQIERLLNMDTRGKSTAQIREEIVRISGDLPQGHPLRTVPKTFAERSQAIAAYTAVRQAIFSNSKEGAANMASKKKAAPAAAAAADTTQAAAAPAAAEAAAPAAGKKAAAKKAVAAAEGAAAPAAAGKKAAGKDATKLAADAKAKGGRKPADLDGPFRLTKVAVDAKEPSGLRMHEGSARYKLMEHCMKRKSQKPITLEEMTTAAGEGTRQALAVCIKLGYIEKVAA